LKVLLDINTFKQDYDVIVANRMTSLIEDVKDESLRVIYSE